MSGRRVTIVLGCLAAASVAGCSLLYPFDLPDATDGETVDGDDGAADADADDGGDVEPTCNNGRVDPGEDCDPSAPRDCDTTCDSTGVEDCSDACELRGCIAPSESCNGADDDCDDETDEGYECAAGLPVACTTPCGVSGTATCSAACEIPPPWECGADVESCNGCDDDRDGTTDEDCPCAAGWALEHPLAPGPESLASISFTADGYGIAVGAAGLAMHYDAGRWAVVSTPTAINLKHVRVFSRSFAVAVGSYGAVLFWDGTRWEYDPEPAGLLPTSALYSVHILGVDDIWISAAGGRVLHFDGSAWTLIDTGVTQHLYEIWAFADDDVYAVGRSGTAVHFDGVSWTSISPGWLTVDLDGLWAADPSTVYVAGGNGTIAAYDTAGGTWRDIPSGVLETFTAMWGCGADDIWISGGWSGGAILHFDGTTWTVHTEVPDVDRMGPIGITCAGPDDAYVATHDGGILHWNGSQWRPMEGAVTVALGALWGVSPQDVYAVGTAGVIGGVGSSTAVLRYDGAAWTSPHWLADVDGRDAWAASTDDLYLLGANGTIPHWDGDAWATLTVGFAGMDLHGVWGVDASHVYLVGGQLSDPWNPVVFERDGAGWSPIPFRPGLPDEQFLDVHGISADVLVAVGTAGAIGHRAVGEAFFDQLPSGTTETLRGVWVFSDDDAFAVGDAGVILRWDGASWTSMTTASDPWAGLRLSGIWGSSADNVFVAGGMGLLLRFDGTRWTVISTDLPHDLQAVWGSSASNVFALAGDRSGKILHRCGPAW